MTTDRSIQEWCDARDPDPSGVGWDDPRYAGTLLLLAHETRVLYCVIEHEHPIAVWALKRLDRLNQGLHRLRREGRR